MLHRLLYCQAPAAAILRDTFFKGIGHPTRQQLEEDSVKKFFWGRGMARHPADEWPETTNELDSFARVRGEQVDISEVVGTVGGEFFWDGSADQHPIQECRRAGWGVTFVDKEGRTTARMVGPVWANLPHTSQASEHCGLAASLQMVGKTAIGCSDCKAGVEAGNKQIQQVLAR